MNNRLPGWLRISTVALFLLAGEHGNQAFAQTNPFTSDADIRQGSALFQAHCSYCHGVRGEGGRGADLTAGVYRMGGADADLFKSIRSGVPGSEMPAVRVTEDEVWKMVAFVKRLGSQGLGERAPGDPAAGKLVYNRIGCAGCHRIAQDGADVGPELSDIGRRRGVAFLEESLLKPEAVMPVNYRAIQVVLKSGVTVTGIRLNEDDLSVQVRDAGGNPRSFLKDSVKEIRHDKPSLMPSYEAALGKQDLANVVAYLSSLKGLQ